MTWFRGENSARHMDPVSCISAWSGSCVHSPSACPVKTKQVVSVAFHCETGLSSLVPMLSKGHVQ